MKSIRDRRITRYQPRKNHFAFHPKHSQGDGGRIFNERALRSFTRSRAAREDAKAIMPYKIVHVLSEAVHVLVREQPFISRVRVRERGRVR
jgi:hypothetical protein